jgi:hypothetical protein
MGYASPFRGIEQYVANNDLIASLDNEENGQILELTKVKEFEIIENILASEFRIKFSIKTNGEGNIYAQIYKNGVAVGTLRKLNHTNFQEYSEDISNWRRGDLMQLWIYTDGGTCNGWWKNFRIYGSKGLGVINLNS